MARAPFLFAPWLALSFALPSLALAAEEMVLSKVMKGHGKNMQAIAGGLAQEDYELVAKAALAVADPPHPPSTMAEKLRLMGFLGSDIGRFKTLDGEAKEQAMALVRAARARNGEASIAAFQRLQLGCLACHAEFRKPFQDHFSTRD